MLWWKFPKFLLSFLKAQVSFPSNVALIFSAIKQNSPILFLAQTLYTLFKKSPLKCNFLRFLNAQVKIRQIPHVNFELTSRFLFKFCIILQCLDTNLPCKFRAHTFLTFNKSMPSRFQFGDFQVLWWKFAKLLMSIFGNTSQFSFKFVPILSAIKHNSVLSVLFWLKHYIIWSKAAHDSVSFWDW